MDKKKAIFLTGLLVVLGWSSGYGQVVCFLDNYAIGLVWDANNCPIAATVSASPGGGAGITVMLDPNPFQWPGMAGSMMVQGTLTGDLGTFDPTGSPPVLSFSCQTIQPRQVVLGAAVDYAPGVHYVQATIERCDGTAGKWVAGLALNAIPIPPVNQSTPCSTPILIDPVASKLLSGNAVLSNAAAIAAASAPSYVSGAAADGVTQLIVEVPTGPGDKVELSVLNEYGQQDLVEKTGGLFPLGGNPANAASTLTVLAENTSTPIAIALYRAPANYWRATQDDDTASRWLSIRAKCMSADGSPTTVTRSFLAHRPPVVLVHGLWSSPDA